MDQNIDRDAVLTHTKKALDEAEPGFGTFFLARQLRFLRPVTGDCRCEARLLRPGRRVVQLESRLYDSGGRLAAFAAGSWYRSNSRDSGVPHG
jgi:acyl-coenzyme A thioesterase PaaI-like protein